MPETPLMVAAGDAIHTYSLLTVGDGLVSQIPALLLSVATGLVVTRSVSDGDMGSDIIRQLGQHKLPLRVAGGAAAREFTPGIARVPGGTGRSRMTGMRSPYVIAW